MNKLRAKEIAASPELIHVTCNDVPIYIQHVDDANNTARIFPLADREKEQVVSLDMLTEG
nr:H-type small acid-soluble spore protein [Sutcliffiella halmapala]